mmetsp:Transcript_28551/g.77311  ORF Transcript_28551/g.77311 Transcript_28551/m.77311 type:complete len:108 (+) Transcript_28551:489-812(+)
MPRPRAAGAAAAPPHRLPPPQLPVPLRESQVLARVPVLAPPLEPSSSQRELPPPLALPPREPSLRCARTASGSSSRALRGHDGRLTQSRRRAIARGGCGGRASDAAS